MSDNLSGKNQSNILGGAFGRDRQIISHKNGAPYSDMYVYKSSAEESMYKEEGGARDKQIISRKKDEPSSNMPAEESMHKIVGSLDIKKQTGSHKMAAARSVKYKNSTKKATYKQLGGALNMKKNMIFRKKGAPISDKILFKGSAEGSTGTTREKTVDKEPEESEEYTCDPCISVGEHAEAEGFCIECGDYLCNSCFKAHAKNKASRHHGLLDRPNMPKKYKNCEPCTRAGDHDEKAFGYCNDCSEYLCSNCFRSHLRNKASSHHDLLDKDNMPPWKTSLTQYHAKTSITEQDETFGSYNGEYTYVRDIKVKSADDEKDCHIISMTLVNGKLILADLNNKSLKLFDLNSNVLKDKLKLETFPNGIEAITNDQLLVVLEEMCQILIISVSEVLAVTGTLDTDGKCLNIKCVNGKMYMSLGDPVKFQILDMSGSVSKTINPDTKILKHCTVPLYIAVSHDESKIYISDWMTSNVMCMDMDGHMVSVYKGRLGEPNDITVSPFGSVYLCNRRQHIVHEMEPDLSEAKVILRQGHGLEYPYAICFNAFKKQLFISSGCEIPRYCNFINVFEWK